LVGDGGGFQDLFDDLFRSAIDSFGGLVIGCQYLAAAYGGDTQRNDKDP
jgi:hypothetical protein